MSSTRMLLEIAAAGPPSTKCERGCKIEVLAKPTSHEKGLQK